MDKLLHITVGLIVFYLFGLWFTIGVALIKEWIDYQIHGKPDYLDFIATIFLPVIITIWH